MWLHKGVAEEGGDFGADSQLVEAREGLSRKVVTLRQKAGVLPRLLLSALVPK